MLTTNHSFLAVTRVHKMKAKAKPCPYEQTNFEEFRKVYSERKLCLENSHYRPSSARPKNELKTIKLQIPILGSENAIVGVVPVLQKKAPIKSILKKTFSTPVRRMRSKDLVKKLTKLEKDVTEIKSSTSSSEDLRNKSNNIYDKRKLQQAQTNSNVSKTETVSQIRQNLPASQNQTELDYLKIKFPSRIKYLLQKDKDIRKAKVSDILVHQDGPEDADLQVLYENKAYLENLKGIIDGLDHIMRSDE